jgi:hypothetical protein
MQLQHLGALYHPMAKNKTLRVGEKGNLQPFTWCVYSMIFCVGDFAEGIENVLW